MAKLDDLFKIMVNNNASDLHLTSGSPPALRVHGDIEPLNYRPLTHEECHALIYEIMTPDQRKNFEDNWECDFSYSLENVGRFRCNIFNQRKGIAAVFRYIPSKIQTLQELNLPPAVRAICKEKKGLVCVTGPTGSGKSTTLAAMVDFINKEYNYHILTVEDPIEFVHENQRSIINQREVSNHTKSFAKALKAALREDPDVILVGEMRDLETISLAMTAAETGHLVFGTLHTMSAAKTVDRIIDAFPQAQQAQIRVMLSESLRGVVAQTLFPRADQPGRIAAFEILVNTFAISNLIREGKTFQIPSAMQTGGGDGMMTFESHLKTLVGSGKVSRENAENFLGRSIKDDGIGSQSRPQQQTQKPATPRPSASATAATLSPAAKAAAASLQGSRPVAPTPNAPPKPAPEKPTAVPNNDGDIKIHSTEESAISGLKNFVFGGNKKTGS
ncbi:MAG: type IV pilus twitching motility protein PilT [Bdellovibrionales bacterium]|nr:type IV pilus twitching motility protein PilT [Bdellovibrionales bacterium]